MADVQAAFLMVLRGEDVVFASEGPLPGFEPLRARIRANHEAYRAFFATQSADGLGRQVHIPRVPGPPCMITLDEALTQVAMHTQHHRGQLIARIDEHAIQGGVP